MSTLDSWVVITLSHVATHASIREPADVRRPEVTLRVRHEAAVTRKNAADCLAKILVRTLLWYLPTWSRAPV